MMTAMLDALRELFGSKKFLTAIVAMAVAGGAHFGLNVNPEVTMTVLGMFAILIHAQGQADQGKEAAKITANTVVSTSVPNANESTTTSKSLAAPPPKQSGHVVVGVLLVGGLVAMLIAIVTACNLTGGAGGVKDALIDCALVDVGQTVDEIGTTLVGDVVIISASDDPASAFTNLLLKYGNDALACAMRAASDVLTAHPPHVSAPPDSPQVKTLKKYMADKQWRFK